MPTEKDPLKALNDELLAIPATDVREPNLPMAVFNQQGADLVSFLEEHPEVRKRLEKVGLPKEVLGGLAIAIGASSAAESAWQAVYSPRRPEAVIALEERAAALRADVVAACRWNLRDDRVAQGTLDAVQEGKGSADLVQDLETLAVLVEQHDAAFKQDQTFDVKQRVKDCRAQAKELREAISGARADLSRAEAKELRDRAFTHADHLLDQVRAAARYVFADEPETLAKFRDRHALRLARSYRRALATAPAPVAPQPVDA